MSGACNCCTEPTSVTPFIQWDTSSVSKSAPACYFDPFTSGGPDALYKKKTTVITSSGVGNASKTVTCDPGGTTAGSWYDTDSSTKTTVWDYSSSCDTPPSCSGSAERMCSWDCSDPWNPPDVGSSNCSYDPCTNTTCFLERCLDCVGAFPPCTTTYTDLSEPTTPTNKTTGGKTVVDCPTYTEPLGLDCIQTRAAHTENESLTVSTLEGEYTRSEHKAAAEAELPPLDGDWDDTAGSYLNWSGWTINLRRGDWRMAHRATPTCYLRVWVQRRFSPKGGGDPVITPLDDYVWNGSGTPCFPDPSLSVNAPENLITGDAASQALPDSEGTITIEIIKWSYLPDYTPGDGDPNGFPPEAA